MRNDQQARRIEVECGVVVFLVVTAGPGAVPLHLPSKGTARERHALQRKYWR